ncbi:transglutaminase family protein [Chenggangzhangella methanolivorans]|uniref:transglutaminase-like domain-containing protein n=1 Tax=Chenggangzhangella methanolivorans TaxID=1437009 RepID=UPI0028F44215|nr:transglutaminase family protein [Chenggangzhangella methanolivorans]
MALDPEAKDPAGSAAEAFGVKRGTPQDLAHVFLAAARSLGSPGRYVTGYLHLKDGGQSATASLSQSQDGQTQSMGAAEAEDEDDGPRPQNAAHCWAEAYAPGLGWVGFDPSLGLSTTESHVRVAIGLDHLGAAPTRGSRYGGIGETFSVDVSVEASGGPRAFRRA